MELVKNLTVKVTGDVISDVAVERQIRHALICVNVTVYLITIKSMNIYIITIKDYLNLQMFFYTLVHLYLNSVVLHQFQFSRSKNTLQVKKV